MPLKSKKSRSKRVTLKTKYKIIRKVKEHRKKERKLEKQNAKKKKGAHRVTAASIPNEWPFRAELLKELELKQKHEEALEEEKKQKRKEQRAENKRKAREENEKSVEQLKEEAESRQLKLDILKKARVAAQEKAKRNDDPDGSRRAFYSTFVPLVERSDVVVMVLDARDPLNYRCVEAERYVLSHTDKQVVLLLNKIDLIPRESAKQWLAYLRAELPTVAMKSQHAYKQPSKKASNRKEKRARLHDAEDDEGELGADTVKKMLRNYARSQKRESLTVGLVGFANVGKSCILNTLVGSQAAPTGNTPGITRELQEVEMDKTITLLDSPAIIFPRKDENYSPQAAVFRNTTRVDRIPDPISAVEEILKSYPAENLMELYQISHFDTCDEFLQQFAVARGKLKKGATVIPESAARLLLQDWASGKIPHYASCTQLKGRKPKHSTDFQTKE
eukprot:gene23347-28252_t